MYTVFEKIRSGISLVLKNVTIEPLMFIFCCALGQMIVINENLRIGRFCHITLKHSEEDCSNLLDGNHSDIQVETQKLENKFLVYESYVSFFFEIILLLLIASWSDKNGRLIPMLIGLFGYIMYTTVYLLTSIITSWSAWVLLSGTLIKSMTASGALMFMAAYSFISDITEESSRTSRLLYLQVVNVNGMSAGLALGPILYHAHGYVLVYATCIIMLMISVIYAIIVMKGHKGHIDYSHTNKDIIEYKDNDSRNVDNSNNKCKKMIKLLRNIKENIKELINSSTRKREGHKRFIINFLVFIFLMEMASVPQKVYIWTRRVLLWDQDIYSLYSIFGKWGSNIIMLIFAPIIKYFNIHDCTVTAVLQFLMFCQTLSFGLTTGPSLWFIPLIFIGVPSYMQFVTLRSLLSKQCEANEVGRMFSLVAIAECIWPIFENSLYGAIYDITLEDYPSAIHLVAAVFNILTLSFILLIKLLLSKDEKDGINKQY